METVNDESIEAALNFIRDKAKDLANARATVKYLEQKRKSLKATHYLECTEGTIQERESRAYTHPDYMECLSEYKDAVYDAEILATQMKAAELRIEVWRSLNARNRSGHV